LKIFILEIPYLSKKIKITINIKYGEKINKKIKIYYLIGVKYNYNKINLNRIPPAKIINLIKFTMSLLNIISWKYKNKLIIILLEFLKKVTQKIM